jgi:anti-anti-sigma factor
VNDGTFTISRGRVDGSPDVMIVAGELDMASAPALIAALDAIDGSEPLLDLSEVTFIDSHGVHALLEHADGLVVVCPAGPVRRILSLTCADRTLRISPTLAEAACLAARD